MPSVAVCAFQYNVVGNCFGNCGVAYNWFALASQIACGKNIQFFAAFFNFYGSDCGTQNVSRIVEFQADSIANKHGSVIWNSNRLPYCPYRVLLGKKRSPCKLFSFFMSLALQVFCVVRLNVCGVHHNQTCNVPCRGGSVNIILVALLYQHR